MAQSCVLDHYANSDSPNLEVIGLLVDLSKSCVKSENATKLPHALLKQGLHNEHAGIEEVANQTKPV